MRSRCASPCAAPTWPGVPARSRTGIVGWVLPAMTPSLGCPGRGAAAIVPAASGFDDGAVVAADVAPVHVEGWIVRDGEPGGQLLVEVDAQAGLVVGVV